jgi:ribonuclease HI
MTPTDPTTQQRCTVPITRSAIFINSQRIKPSTSARYLGVLIDQELHFKEQAELAIRKATERTLAYRHPTNQAKGVVPNILRKLYLATIVPKMFYVADVWLTLPHWKVRAKRSTGWVLVIKRLALVQHIATLSITGAMGSTASDILDCLAFTLPVNLLAEKEAFESALRLATLPAAHSLHKLIRRISSRNRKRLHSPLHHLLACFLEVELRRMKKIPLVAIKPWHHLAFTTAIARSRKEVICEAKHLPDTHAWQVYSDRSGREGHAGASAVLYRYNEEIRQFPLGPLIGHTVYKAEAVAVALGLHLLCSVRQLKGHIDIGPDNQAVITVVTVYKPRSGSHIMGKVIETSEDIWDRMQQHKRLYLQWTPGHEGIRGNKRADKLARAAAQGTSSEAKSLPKFLRQKDRLSMNKAVV